MPPGLSEQSLIDTVLRFWPVSVVPMSAIARLVHLSRLDLQHLVDARPTIFPARSQRVVTSASGPGEQVAWHLRSRRRPPEALVGELVEVAPRSVQGLLKGYLAGQDRRSLSQVHRVPQARLYVIESIYKVGPPHLRRPDLVPIEIFAGNVALYDLPEEVAMRLRGDLADAEVVELSGRHRLPEFLLRLIQRREQLLSASPEAAVEAACRLVPRARGAAEARATKSVIEQLRSRWADANDLWGRGWPRAWIAQQLSVNRMELRLAMARCRRLLGWFDPHRRELAEPALLEERFTRANRRWIEGEFVDAIAEQERMSVPMLMRMMRRSRRVLGPRWFPQIAVLAAQHRRDLSTTPFSRAEMALAFGFIGALEPPAQDLPAFATTASHMAYGTRFANLVDDLVRALSPSKQARAEPLTEMGKQLTSAVARLRALRAPGGEPQLGVDAP